jgi:hypothetical protein
LTWVKELNLRLQTLKLLQKTIEKTLEETDNYFLNKTLIVQEIKAKINKWNCYLLIKLKDVCTS